MIFLISPIRSMVTFGRQAINIKGTWNLNFNHSLQSI